MTPTYRDTVTPLWWTAALYITAFALAMLPAISFAQDHHPLHRDFYNHWRDPQNPSMSCCNARIEKDGAETGDCEPTKAEIRKGDWWVWIRQLGTYAKVDDKRIIRERNPNGQDAHLCWTPHRGIICFSPPDTGG